MALLICYNKSQYYFFFQLLHTEFTRGYLVFINIIVYLSHTHNGITICAHNYSYAIKVIDHFTARNHLKILYEMHIALMVGSTFSLSRLSIVFSPT